MALASPVQLQRWNLLLYWQERQSDHPQEATEHPSVREEGAAHLSGSGRSGRCFYVGGNHHGPCSSQERPSPWICTFFAIVLPAATHALVDDSIRTKLGQESRRAPLFSYESLGRIRFSRGGRRLPSYEG